MSEEKVIWEGDGRRVVTREGRVIGQALVDGEWQYSHNTRKIIGALRAYHERFGPLAIPEGFEHVSRKDANDTREGDVLGSTGLAVDYMSTEPNVDFIAGYLAAGGLILRRKEQP